MTQANKSPHNCSTKCQWEGRQLFIKQTFPDNCNWCQSTYGWSYITSDITLLFFNDEYFTTLETAIKFKKRKVDESKPGYKFALGTFITVSCYQPVKGWFQQGLKDHKNSAYSLTHSLTHSHTHTHTLTHSHSHTHTLTLTLTLTLTPATNQ